jgi:hypothetical protein
LSSILELLGFGSKNPAVLLVDRWSSLRIRTDRVNEFNRAIFFKNMLFLLGSYPKKFVKMAEKTLNTAKHQNVTYLKRRRL